MLPGETIHSGAEPVCPECKVELKEEVLYSPAGYYIGTRCNCGPYSRESHYYKNKAEAEFDLEHKQVKYRT